MTVAFSMPERSDNVIPNWFRDLIKRNSNGQMLKQVQHDAEFSMTERSNDVILNLFQDLIMGISDEQMLNQVQHDVEINRC